MPENNERQAMVPEGATVLANAHGTAPGLWLEKDGQIVVLLPGPPPELKGMFPQVEQRLARLAPVSGGVRLYTRELRVAGMPESEVEQRVAPIYRSYGGAQTTLLASPGEIQVHLRAWSANEAAANQLLEEMTKRMEMVLGEALFTTQGEALEEVVAQLLIVHGATIAAAESCTGGLLSERLTRIPGSSSYFLGGVICYSNDVKSSWVDVPREIMEAKGAVSAEVCCALAEGIRRRSGAALGVAITGIAGPGGGSPEKPVGTVHIGLADSSTTRERRFQFPGDRERIRYQATQMALDMVRRYFLFGAKGKE